MLKNVYIEIGNICNLNCSFCPKTKREARQMSNAEFRGICEKLIGKAEHLLFHVMGEPLLHPELGDFLNIAAEFGYSVSITTNGTLLASRGGVILENSAPIKRVSISLHAFEGNETGRNEEYLLSAIEFAKALSAKDKNAVFRLWNLDTEERSGKNSENEKVVDTLKLHYPEPWEKRYTGYRIANRTFLEYDGIFTWPSESPAEAKENGTCHALRHQIAILADGTVVPCCLDSEGNMPLGNIFHEDISDIMNSKLASEMLKGFRDGRYVHPLCKKCTYSRRFKI